jgi:hypothetical protein
MSFKRKRPTAPAPAPREQATMELFSFLKRLSEHHEMTGKLWSQVAPYSNKAQECYKKAAEALERACALLEQAVESRESTLIALNTEESE